MAYSAHTDARLSTGDVCGRVIIQQVASFAFVTVAAAKWSLSWIPIQAVRQAATICSRPLQVDL